MAEFKTFDEKGNEINVKKEDFSLIVRNKKIHDVEFESKPTTFAKDAFKRFCKNKSSVVGAIIIGILIVLSIFVPIISPHDIKTPSPDIIRLPGKLFNAGSGFWDGTQKIKHVVYDVDSEAPTEYKKNAVIKILNSETTTVNAANKYANGGVLLIVNNQDRNTAIKYFHNFYTIDINQNDNYKLNVSLSDQDGLNGNKLGEYRVLLTFDDKSIELKGWSRDYSDFEIDLSKVLKDNDLVRVSARIRFELGPEYNEDGSIRLSYIGINHAIITSSNTSESVINNLKEVSITDANETILCFKDDNGMFPRGYWQGTVSKELYGATITYVDFIYDWYEAKLGMTTKVIGKTTLDDYIKLKYCEYDYSIGESSFKVLNAKKCPITEVLDQKYNSKDDIYTITVTVENYKYKGYTHMPRFLFGTDANGYDMVKLCFNGLRTSLVLSLCASAVCFIFGLCWGSISGYFGGNVDLFMERFCDILGGIPWIVMMTLAIFYLGQNIVTFGLALCLTGWMGTAARTRTQFYRFKGREYILASRTLGSSDARLIFKHILPNAMGTIITSSVLMIPSTIFSEATLTYLNLLSLDTTTFGTILANNKSELSSHPILILFPAAIISLIMISFNLFGNGLRDAFNPSLKGSE